MLYNDLINLKNAYLAHHASASLPYSKLTLSVLETLEKPKYIGAIKILGEEPHKKIHVELLYTQSVPHLNEIKFHSKPGARIYVKQNALKKFYQKYGDAILSTSQGIMTGKEAHQKKLGGEIICEVF